MLVGCIENEKATNQVYFCLRVNQLFVYRAYTHTHTHRGVDPYGTGGTCPPPIFMLSLIHISEPTRPY